MILFQAVITAVKEYAVIIFEHFAFQSTAEAVTLQQYCERAQIKDGMDVMVRIFALHVVFEYALHIYVW